MERYAAGRNRQAMFYQLGTIAIIIFRIFVVSAPEANCSWYAGSFCGGPTTSGLVYNQYEWTCASAVLPMGTLLWCYSEETGIWCILRVTDGGPYAVDAKGNAIFPLNPHPTRQLDLSTLAFFFLSGGDLDRGIQRIRYQVIGRDVTGMPYPGRKTWTYERELLNRW
jgi:rare lipoprotein A (peptidoglycan hydrolase)